MKRLLFFTLVLLSSIASQGQKASSGRHTSLADCGRDTLRYIRENFIEKKERYVGLKLDSLFKDLEIPIQRFGVTDTYRYRTINGIRWTYLSGNEQDYFKKKGKKFYAIYIIFEEPYTVPRSEWQKIGGYYWRKEHRDFLKDFVIKDFLVWDEIEQKVVK